MKKQRKNTQALVRLIVILPLFFLGGAVGYRMYKTLFSFAQKKVAPQSIVIKCQKIYSPLLKKEIESFIVTHLGSIDYLSFEGHRRRYMTTFEGVVPNLQRRYRDTSSEYQQSKNPSICSSIHARTCVSIGSTRFRLIIAKAF